MDPLILTVLFVMGLVILLAFIGLSTDSNPESEVPEDLNPIIDDEQGPEETPPPSSDTSSTNRQLPSDQGVLDQTEQSEIGQTPPPSPEIPTFKEEVRIAKQFEFEGSPNIESEVSAIIQNLLSRHPRLVTSVRPCRIEFKEGTPETVDFDLLISLRSKRNPEKKYHLIECLNPTRSLKSVIHKIIRITDNCVDSELIMVYANVMPKELNDTIPKKGTRVLSLTGFESFLERLGDQLDQ
jgi:hypothetical protein